MQVTTAIETDRAVRSFRDESISSTEIRELLALGQKAGSAKNRQPWEVVVVRDRENLETLAVYGEYTTPLTEAAAGIVLLSDTESDQHRREVDAFDYGRFVQNVMLAAVERGMGTVPQGITTTPEVRNLLDLDETQEVFLIIALGFPASNEEDLIEGKSKDDVLKAAGRRRIEEITHWEKYGATE